MEVYYLAWILGMLVLVAIGIVSYSVRNEDCYGMQKWFNSTCSDREIVYFKENLMEVLENGSIGKS